MESSLTVPLSTIFNSHTVEMVAVGGCILPRTARSMAVRRLPVAVQGFPDPVSGCYSPPWKPAPDHACPAAVMRFRPVAPLSMGFRNARARNRAPVRPREQPEIGGKTPTNLPVFTYFRPVRRPSRPSGGGLPRRCGRLQHATSAGMVAAALAALARRGQARSEPKVSEHRLVPGQRVASAYHRYTGDSPLKPA